MAAAKKAAVKRLATYVHVDLGGGEFKAFGPGDEVPAEVAEKITNPKAWAGEDEKSDQADPEGE